MAEINALDDRTEAALVTNIDETQMHTHDPANPQTAVGDNPTIEDLEPKKTRGNNLKKMEDAKQRLLNQKLNTQIASLKTEVKQLKKEANKQKTVLTESNEQIGLLKGQLDEAWRTNDTQDAENKSLTDENTALQHEIQSMRTDQVKLREATNENLKLMKTIDTLKGKMALSEAQRKQLETKLDDCLQVQDESEKEYRKVKQLLEEVESERTELLEQLDSSNASVETDSSQPKPIGIVVFDKVAEPIVSRLDTKVTWEKKLTNLEEMVNLSELSHADIVLLMIGSEDIRGGMKGQEAFAKLKAIITEVRKDTSVVVMDIPPSNQRGASGRISLMNFKLGKLELENVKFIETTSKSTLREEILDQNDALLDQAVAHISRQINATLTIPTTLKIRNVPSMQIPVAEQSYYMQEVVKIEKKDIGKIIGKSGSTITRLSKDFGVNLNIGKWSEPKRENKEEFEQKMDGVLIMGNSNDVKEAAHAIRNLLDIEEPAEKKRKY